MSLFQKLIKKSVKNFIIKRKKWLISITVFFGVLIGLNYIVNHYVNTVVGDLIREFVHDKSNGFYKVDFENIGYILNDGRFSVTNFKFEIHPDFAENLDYENLKQSYIYLASIPRLHIDIIEFWSIFINRKLRVIGVEIKTPKIEIINLNKNKKPKKISFEAGNLYQALSGNLTELRINQFKIVDGQLTYETHGGPDYDNFQVKGIDFEVKNFQVNENSQSRTDKVFYTDDISLAVRDQLLLLKDSIHKVTFDRFYISTLKNELGFENFKLTKRENFLSGNKKHDHYDVFLPQFKFSGIDFIKAYNDNYLVIDSIQILDPLINIEKRIIKPKKDSSGNNVLDLAMIYNDFLNIKHFNLSGAKLVFTDATTDRPKTYSVENVSAYMGNVEIDTGRNSKYKYGFDFDKANLMIKDYEVTLPDSVNMVKFEEFSITSDPVEITLKNLSVQSDPKQDELKAKSRIYAAIPFLVISDFDVAKAINRDTFSIKELYIENPIINLQPAALVSEVKENKNGIGGLFGSYESLKSFSKLFTLDNLRIVNGTFNLENPPDTKKSNLSINNIQFSLDDLWVDSLTNTENDLLGRAEISIALSKSNVILPNGNIDIGNLTYKSTTGRFQVNDVDIRLDSSASDQKLNANIAELYLSGIRPNQILFDSTIVLDTIKFQEAKIDLDLLDNSLSDEKEVEKISSKLPRFTVNHFIGLRNHIQVKSRGLPTFIAGEISVEISGLMIDQSLSDNPLNQFDYDNLDRISIDKYDMFLRKQKHLFAVNNISWNNKRSTFSMENITIKPYSKTDNSYDISIPLITMSGINLKKVLKESYYDGDEILIDQPVFNLRLSQGEEKKMKSLDLGFIPLLLRNKYHGVKSNTLNIKNASINLHQKVEDDSLIIEAERLNFLVDNFEVDSTSKMVPNRFLFANDVKLQGDYLSAYFKSKSDFYNINHYYISTKDGDINLDGIYYATNTKNEFPKKGRIKFSAKSFGIKNLNFFNITQNRTLDVSDIMLDNALFHLIPGIGNEDGESTGRNGKAVPTDTLILDNIAELLNSDNLFQQPQNESHNNGVKTNITDSLFLDNITSSVISEASGQLKKKKSREGLNVHKKDFLFDTLLLKSIDIDRILISDSKVNLENADKQKTGLIVPDLWLLAEGIKYDPISAKDSSRILYTDNLVAKITNFSYTLPDNLSSIRIDELLLNSKDSTIIANNFAFIPLASRYDYGHAKGFQSTWLQIENKSINLEKVDFLSLINKNSFSAQSLNVNYLDISVFRDKRNPFPEWQRRPLPQHNLREMNFTFCIDTILVNDGFISYQEHAEKAYTTGEVFFSDVKATILNLTNDSIRTNTNRNARIGMTALAFGKGRLKAEFLFDLVNMDNIHTYGIEVDPFDLTEFNRILVPSASVQISSGQNNKIMMSAKADNKYSYGEMKFYYEDLKIALLNRETETPKGVGRALGSFFANTFIIKSNNPRNLFLRKGDIFYERDEKRAIFNYWTKTFLSGVVSSIGATNNKKKIKKMQDEDLKEIKKRESLEAKLNSQKNESKQ